MKYLLYIIPGLISLIIFGCVIVKKIEFTQNCEGYLKRAADANTIELALENLNIAIDYIEKNNLTNGYTSVLWKTPDEDLGFWYQNIKQCQKELTEIAPDAPIMDKTNMLMKLRESLTDDGEKGVVVTVPDGISRYPNNCIWGILIFIAVFLFSWAITYAYAITD